MKSLLKHTSAEGSFLLFDSSSMPYQASGMAHFALTDALIQHAGFEKQPILHFWTTPPLVILGMMDTKLPYFSQALEVFNEEKFEVVIRNSGGLGVVSDPGVLNVSLIFPEEDQRLPIDEGYKRMHELIQTAFKEHGDTIEAYEIPDSYCPGEYDLSVEGKKIAGISQRRIKGGVAIMIYLTINGDQDARANLIRQFYDQGLQGTETKWHFPKVNPEVMTTLEEAFQPPLSVYETKQRILTSIEESGFHVKKGVYTDLVHHHYMNGLEKMKKRNQQFLPSI